MTIRQALPITLIALSLSACGGTPPPLPVEPDLLGVLKTRPSLKRFTEAFESTGVAGSLEAGGAYTILAPMDKAVSNSLDEATIRHHILTERVAFSDMAGESTSYETLDGGEIEVDVTDRIAVGTGLMVESDIAATNGIIHVIDRVQEPSSGSAAIEAEPLESTTLTDPIVNTVIPAAPTVSPQQ